MNPLRFATVHCPYCGVELELNLDTSAGDQRYIEDCQVCCRPIELNLAQHDKTWTLEARRDDE